MGDLRARSKFHPVFTLPMAFETRQLYGAVERYQESVCAKAPWLPNNVDFIQRINGFQTAVSESKTSFSMPIT